MKKKVAIIQARMESTRFPGKIVLPFGIEEKPVITFLCERLLESNEINSICVAAPSTFLNKKLGKILPDKYRLHFGSMDNVLNRVYQAANINGAEIIIDITADCPFVEPRHIDKMYAYMEYYDLDYISNIHPRGWPDGFDIQIYTKEILDITTGLVQDEKHLSHSGWNIVNYKKEIEKILGRKMKTENFAPPEKYNYPDWRLTLDTKEDYKFMNTVCLNLQRTRQKITAENIIDYVLEHMELLKINCMIETKIPGEG